MGYLQRRASFLFATLLVGVFLGGVLCADNDKDNPITLDDIRKGKFPGVSLDEDDHQPKSKNALPQPGMVREVTEASRNLSNAWEQEVAEWKVRMKAGRKKRGGDAYPRFENELSDACWRYSSETFAAFRQR
jgi:hypothetical protein